MISFDFETRSLAPLPQCGAWVYSEHPSTAVLCYAFAVDDGEVIAVQGHEMHPALLKALLDGHHVRAWNAFFEWAIWHNVCVPRYGWPALSTGQIVDTMAYAAVKNLPQGLEDCALVLGLQQQKDKRGKRLIQLLSVPIKDTQEFREDAALLAEMTAYCAQDVRAERAIAERLGNPINRAEAEVFRFTLEMNLRGLPISVADAQAIEEVVEVELARVNATVHELTGGAAEKLSQAARILKWAQANGAPDLDDMQEETLDAIIPTLPVGSAVAQVLGLRQSANKASAAKLRRMMAIVGPDGTAKGLSIYHGASTGRYASRGGLNAQNLPRPHFKNTLTCTEVLVTGDHAYAHAVYGDDLMRAVVSTVRGLIKAPPGYDFIDADFSSVENRVGVWLPGQQDKLDMFAAGLDEYKVFASTSLYGCHYDEVTDYQRQVSKSAVLGCLFGQGWRGLIRYARGYGVELEDERSQKIVEAYRDQYSKVKGMWYECDRIAVLAIDNPGQAYKIGDLLSIRSEDDFLVLRLPSGRRIYWYQPRIELLPTPWGEERAGVVVTAQSRVTHKWSAQHLRGASIFQSAVQGTARDLMVEAAMRLEEAGYPVVLTVHDEILSLVRKNHGSEDQFRAIMEQTPAWATGLPIKTESWRGERFRK